MGEPTLVSWKRVEPIPRTSQISVSLAARLADPLWGLCRQWQLGELTGQDAGTPVIAQLGLSVSSLSEWGAGLGGSSGRRPFDPSSAPLEAVVEAEPIRSSHGRLAAESGLEFLRRLDDAGLGHLRAGFLAEYAATFAGDESSQLGGSDEIGAEAALLLHRRVPDARLLAEDLRPFVDAQGELSGLPSLPALDESVRPLVRAIATAWLRWYDALVLEPADVGTPPAWDPRRLEYRFEVAAPTRRGTFAARAESYDDGSLDWSDVVAARPTAEAIGAVEESRFEVLPAPVTFPGMPARRFWEIEDGRVEFASSLGATDVASVLFDEFALVYGEDWFVVPVEHPAGSVITIDSLHIVDTFGRGVVAAPIRRRPPVSWSAFGHGGPEQIVLSLPVVSRRLVGDTVEKVTLARDEMANVVWGIEHLVCSPMGTPVERDREPVRPQHLEVPDGVDAPWVYRLQHTAPANWIPYLPRQVAGAEAGVTELRRATVAGADRQRGVLLNESIAIEEEEVSRAGVVVERRWELARWYDGRTVTWLGRQARTAHGELSSGLAWDHLEPMS